MNCINGPGTPRYWAVECSSDRLNWVRVSEYTVPDFVASSARLVNQLPGTKFISVNLPDSMLGIERVYVRLIPVSTSVGTATDYVGSASVNTDRYNAINYLAIRYNR